MTHPDASVRLDHRLAPLRDDGWLDGRIPVGRVPLPEGAWLAAALLAALVAPATGAPGDAGAWVGGGVLLALVGASGRGGRRLRWLGPPLLRALEYGSVLLLAGGSGWSYLLLAVLAFHHYDIVYRGRLRAQAPPRWLGTATGGWPVRLALLAVAGAVGAAESVTVVLSLVLLPIYTSESIASWSTARR